jgi:protein SCO1/2
MKKKYVLQLIIPALCLGMLLYHNLSTYRKKERAIYLPHYGNKGLNTNFDTVYHSIHPFCFVNQLRDTITDQEMLGKNYVAEFFFTTCKSICPIMNENMRLVAKKIKGDTNFKILSHTVKPHEDSVPVLLEYAKNHGADNTQWYFLTGNPTELFKMARYSYLVTTDSIAAFSPDDFVHTQLFALVDKQGNIRGYYDGTSESEVKKLISDIDLLKKEQYENIIK